MIDDFMAALEKEGVFARQTVGQDDATTGRAQEEAEEALAQHARPEGGAHLLQARAPGLRDDEGAEKTKKRC